MELEQILLLSVYSVHTLLEWRSWCAWAVEVDVLPLAVSAMPDASLLWLAGPRPTLAVNELSQADVGDAGCILADQVHMGVQDGGVDRLAVLSQNWKDDEDNVIKYDGTTTIMTGPVLLLMIQFSYINGNSFTIPGSRKKVGKHTKAHIVLPVHTHPSVNVSAAVEHSSVLISVCGLGKYAFHQMHLLILRFSK